MGFFSAFIVMSALLVIGTGLWFFSYQKHRKEKTTDKTKRKMPIQVETRPF